MLKVMRKPLPATFRINGRDRFAAALRDRLKGDIIKELESEELLFDGEKISPPRPLPWYPDELAWQLDLSRNQIRKIPILKKIHEFLKRENEVGSITRQEAVSMVPPFFLDVRPGHAVLDTCAAPGSKTCQLVEMITEPDGSAPRGLVIANDAEAQRCSLLTHQTQRANCPALVVCNHEAQNFPLIRATRQEPGLLFDRVLCDVPCSGDGTTRKAPDIWQRWRVSSGNGLHRLQVKILVRGGELLKVGGRVVYSTCSLNPIENEAVVAEFLRRTDGAFELLDLSETMPQLKRRPGLKRWQVRDKNGWIEDASKVEMGRSSAFPTMFPDAASDAMPLERCMRFLAHDGDTGAFFVCAFEKKREWNQNLKGDEAGGGGDAVAVTTASPGADGGATANEGGAVAAKAEHKEAPAQGVEGNRKGGRWRGVDPVTRVTDPELLGRLRSAYGLVDTYPIEKHLITRTAPGLKPKRLYWISERVRDLLERDVREQLKIISTGVKIFERQDNKRGNACPYRVTMESVNAILPHMTKQVYHPTLHEFMRLLSFRGLPCPVLEDESAEAGAEAGQAAAATTDKPAEPTPAVAPEAAAAGAAGGGDGDRPKIVRPPLDDPRTVRELESVGQGCCVARLRPEDVTSVFGEGADKEDLPVAIVTWRGRRTMNLLIEKVAGRQMLENFPRVEGIPMPSTEKKTAPQHLKQRQEAETKVAAPTAEGAVAPAAATVEGAVPHVAPTPAEAAAEAN